MARTRNVQLAEVIAEAGWTQEQLARRMRQVAAEQRNGETSAFTRSHVNQWVRGVRPGERSVLILCETLSRGLGRTLTPADIGLSDASPPAPEWSEDSATALRELGSVELDRRRRGVLATLGYSAAGIVLPGTSWWETAAERARTRRPPAPGSVDARDVAGVREMIDFFSRRDQRRGGGEGRAALAAYLHTDVAALLDRRAGDEEVRRELFSTAGELTYLCGWMAFDASEHGLAQRYFVLATRLAAEAEDAPLAGHVLRAMAHQAVDLGHPRQALDLATASLERKRYAEAAPREKALIGVVHARALAVAGHRAETMAALRRAEDDLAAARDDGHEPARVFFFGEASLAHETACALRDLGDLKGAEKEFRRSVRTRAKQTFTRTHSVTLGYLGAVQARQGAVEAACDTWGRALDTMEGVRSGRARDTVIDMRRTLSPFRDRGPACVADIEDRARTVLARIG
ncbi:Tat pathway signal protein [Streptomyces alkaliphilus]|uniref:Tat pathway signal protein n=1 Tax=Streptomyces alkaliphilus TaxID=1472722 RepID=UPI0011811D2E|nr:Tat pathway signal protein [Streptomyces alkaliphilus]MQS05703.1 Tat pathway signal protein [Streptomyces alkaliphilus]